MIINNTNGLPKTEDPETYIEGISVKKQLCLSLAQNSIQLGKNICSIIVSCLKQLICAVYR